MDLRAATSRTPATVWSPTESQTTSSKKKQQTTQNRPSKKTSDQGSDSESLKASSSSSAATGATAAKRNRWTEEQVNLMVLTYYDLNLWLPYHPDKIKLKEKALRILNNDPKFEGTPISEDQLEDKYMIRQAKDLLPEQVKICC